MRGVVTLLFFHAVWLAAVLGAAAGNMWLGPLAALAFLAFHLGPVGARRERRRAAVYVLAIALIGTLLDSLLRAAGATAYPSSEVAWPFAAAPPWITALWAAFAVLPRSSLAWMRGRPVLAVLLGAAGGPLSYLAGARLGAVAVGAHPLLTWTALALEYAVLTPLLLRAAGDAPSRHGKSPDGPTARDESPASGEEDRTASMAEG